MASQHENSIGIVLINTGLWFGYRSVEMKRHVRHRVQNAPKRVQAKVSKGIECFNRTIREYVNVSSIQGLKYILDRGANIFIKIFWLTIVVACFVFCNVMVASFWIRYKSSPTVMRVGSSHNPLPTLKLPAITFCHTNRVSSVRAMALINRLVLPANVSSERMLSAIYQTSGFIDSIDYNVADLELLRTVFDLNRYDVRQMMATLQQPCSELLVKCRWEDEIVPCDKLFQQTFAYYGNCCTFNRNNQFAHTNYIGMKGSLSAVLAPEFERTRSSVYSDSVKVIVHEPDVLASSTVNEKNIAAKSEVLVRIATMMTTCSDGVQQLSISDRGCIYESERKLRFFADYREASCDVECEMLRIESLCKCLPYYFVNQVDDNRTPICGFTSIKCLVDNFWLIHGSASNLTEKCECETSCNDAFYDIGTNTMSVYNHNRSIDPFTAGINDSHLVVHIKLGRQVYRRLSKELMTNILSLASNLGGIYSLFVGFSALTLLEIIHYGCVRFYLNYRKMTATERKKSRNTSINQDRLKPVGAREIIRNYSFLK